MAGLITRLVLSKLGSILAMAILGGLVIHEIKQSGANEKLADIRAGSEAISLQLVDDMHKIDLQITDERSELEEDLDDQIIENQILRAQLHELKNGGPCSATCIVP